MSEDYPILRYWGWGQKGVEQNRLPFRLRNFKKGLIVKINDFLVAEFNALRTLNPAHFGICRCILCFEVMAALR